ncbi:hypothetical protein HK097_003923, partial [Rhizophlyctis rosea]
MATESVEASVRRRYNLNNDSSPQSSSDPTSSTEPQPTPTRQPRPSTNTGPFGLPILNKEHTPQNVALIAFTLGITTGLGLLAGTLWDGHPSLAFVSASLALLSVLEYIGASMRNEEKGLSSFIIPFSRHQINFIAVAIAEYSWRAYFTNIPTWGRTWSRYGLVLMIMSIQLRVAFHLVPSRRNRWRQIQPSWIKGSDLALTLYLFAFFNLINGGFIYLLYSIWSSYKRITEGPDPEPAPSPEVESGNGPLSLPIFDNQHSPQNIAAYAYLLGCGVGLGIGMAWLCPTLRGFGVFLAALGVFHTLEYLTTAMYQQGRVGLSSFLLNHSPEYHAAMAGATIEFFLEWYFFRGMKFFTWMNWIGLVIVILAQTLRTTAMITAGSNFSHIIADEKEHSHQLVTTGIYS